MDKYGGPKYYATCLNKQPLVGVATSDTDSGTESKGMDVEALVAACMGNLSTQARCIREIGLLATLYGGAGGAPASGGLRPPCNNLILIIAPGFSRCLESEFRIGNMHNFMKWCIMYPLANHYKFILKRCYFTKSCNFMK